MLSIREEEVFFKAWLVKGLENWISMGFVVMCAEMIRRLFRLILGTILAWFCTWQWPGCLWMGRRNIWLLDMADSRVVV